MQSALTNAQKRGTPCTTPAPIALISVPNPYCTRPGTNVIAICVPENTPVSQKSFSTPPFLMRLRTVTVPGRAYNGPPACHHFATSLPTETRSLQKSLTKRLFYQDHPLFTKTKSHR